MGRKNKKNKIEQQQQQSLFEAKTSTTTPVQNQRNNNNKNDKPAIKKNVQQQKTQRQIRREVNRKTRMANEEQINRQNDFLRNLVNENLINCDEGQELKLLSQLLQPNSEGLYNAYNCIHNDLVNIISQRCKNFEIHPFGSTINGLAFKDSDFDLYIDIKNATGSSLVYAMASIMRRYGGFSNIISIAKARVPIVKCFHLRTGFNCDIGFSNPLGTYNSRNLQHIIAFDCRIHPLAIILKYWLRTHSLSGHGKITHYCLIMMIIFYLQIIPQPILPPLIDFQANIPELIIEHWNVAFNRQLPNNTRNTQGVCELLNGFFKFYSDFNYLDNIICPLYGRSFKRQIFDSNIPIEFNKYKEYLKNVNGAKPLGTKTPFCIQDPFNLAFNMASCGLETYNVILNELKNASKIYEQHLSENEKSSIFLYKLFNSFAPKERQSTLTTINESHKCKIKPSESDLSIIRMVLSKHATVDKPVEIAKVQQMWIKKTMKFIEESLKRFYLFNLDTKNVQKDANNIKIEYKLKATHNTYNHRKFREVGSNYIELEEAESRKRIANNISPIDLTCVVEITSVLPFDTITIEFREPKTGQGKGLFKSVVNTFSLGIGRHLKAFYLDYQTKTIDSSIETTETTVTTHDA